MNALFRLQATYSAFVFIWEYLLPIALFTYFYGHIFIVIRKSSRVFSGQNVHSNNASNVSRLLIYSKASNTWRPTSEALLAMFIVPFNLDFA